MGAHRERRVLLPFADGEARDARLAVAGAEGVRGREPVDAERVQQIKAALKDGSYPLVPTRIADAMIAAQVSLSLPERS